MHCELQPVFRQDQDNIAMIRRKISALNGEEGFTLLESLISLAILSGVIVTILTVLNTHLAASNRLSESTAAMALAVEKIEEIRLYGDKPVDREEEFGYRIKYSEEESEADLKKVCVQVGWGLNEQVGLCAYVPPKG